MEKYVETLKVENEILEEIKTYMEAYSDNGELYAEYGIEEDANLHSLYVEFDNGCNAAIYVNSGQCNCYIDYILFNAGGHTICSIVSDDSLCNGDVIEFHLSDEEYFINIEAI